MNDEPLLSAQLQTPNQASRRVFLKQCGFAVAALAMPWTRAYGTISLPGIRSAATVNGAVSIGVPVCSAVVSLHMDRPYVDLTGSAVPYQACGVMGAAQPLMALSETEWRMRYPYL